MRRAEDWIIPDWPAPSTVRAVSTTRRGGVSVAPYDALNLGDHVGDDTRAVEQNRAHLMEALNLPASPVWLRQVHGARAVDAMRGPCEADAAYTGQPGVVCAVLTADCLPLLLCNAAGTRVAAVHVGWRGLAAGVIEAALAVMGPGADLLAWLGPAIGPGAFEVGNEVRDIFIAHDTRAQSAFRPSPNGRWWADIYQLARLRLAAHGVARVYGGHGCTYSDAGRFYSYRRDGITGRMATMIWLETDAR
ncbi:MAG: peptidoglycan editing factor PgeF [Gammaproteobacteria bacterium]|nr:peptidoglycan editing factor PgeF [Gammaproteobacteria bacterium]